MKAKKTYFVRKDSPKQRDYRFGYQRTPESALKFRVGEYWIEDRQIGMSGAYKCVKSFHAIHGAVYDTKEAAEAVAAKWNQELIDNNGMSNFMKAVSEGKI